MPNLKKSGLQDSNLRPPAPKAGALTGLRQTPSRASMLHSKSGGESGIRTRGTPVEVRQFSKLVVSATHPSLQVRSKDKANFDIPKLLSKKNIFF